MLYCVNHVNFSECESSKLVEPDSKFQNHFGLRFEEDGSKSSPMFSKCYKTKDPGKSGATIIDLFSESKILHFDRKGGSTSYSKSLDRN